MCTPPVLQLVQNKTLKAIFAFSIKAKSALRISGLVKTGTDGPQLTVVRLNDFSTWRWCERDTHPVEIGLCILNFDVFPGQQDVVRYPLAMPAVIKWPRVG